MEPKFMISEVLSTSWKHTKSQIWVLAGLLIGYIIIATTLSLFAIPAEGSIMGTIIVNVISLFISLIFSLGYTKNIFQALDGDEPQFSAYGQQARKILTFFAASLLASIAMFIGLVLFIIPGIYILLRLQFFPQMIVDEDAGIMQSLKHSWEITEGHAMQLFLLLLLTLLLCLLGLITLGVGFFVACPLVYMMQCYVYRKLNSPIQQ
ncbi:MAG: hypothetical protein RR382_09975 [Tannerellaceae bacterium]